MPRTVTSPYADPHMQQLALWTAQMLDAAEGTARLIGCTPEAIVAQAALETGWGRAAIGHNIFGIKANGGWTGAKQLVTTREVINGESVTIQDWFRDYASYADSFADHFQFLKENTRYASVFDPNDTMSDQRYFEELQKDGYATDPNYAHSLMEMLKSVVGLEQHMTNSALPPPAPPAAPEIPPAGYVRTESGNIIRENVEDSSIVKGAKVGQAVTAAAGAASVAAGTASQIKGLFGEVGNVGAICLTVVAVVLIAAAFFYFRSVKNDRRVMNQNGIA